MIKLIERLKEYIDNKYKELYRMIAHSTTNNWDANVDNSDAIDNVVEDALKKASQITSLNESVDDILIYLLKNDASFTTTNEE